MTYHEHHRSHRSGWLRAAVLGANDGIVSTASLIIGVASASADQEQVLIAGNVEMQGIVHAEQIVHQLGRCQRGPHPIERLTHDRIAA